MWQVNSIKEVSVTTKADSNKNGKIDVGPGVEGLDYDKVVRWQQNVDAGRELWRLDPLKVAKTEGRSYGFDDTDTYTVVRKLSSSTIARHGQIDIEVNHDGKLYTMIIVRPFGGGDAIWTTYKVVGKKPPVTVPTPVPSEKVLFETDKFTGWKWLKEYYPKDMAFATIVDYEAQLKQDKRIPEAALQKLKDVDFNNKVALFAYLGGTSGSHGIGIEKVTIAGNKMTVQVRTKSPRPDEMVTMMLTYPSDYVLIDRSVFDIWGGVDITFVDQKGKVLGKNKLTITHR
ncbi:MAG: protease complex subunit PrcB family protein [Veillonellaceae bacterium]|nr:protease complex subunit PrcB family protein [Veillonellaceae bacterium]